MSLSIYVFDGRNLCKQQNYCENSELQQDEFFKQNPQFYRSFRQFLLVEENYSDVSEDNRQLLLRIYDIPLVCKDGKVLLVQNSKDRESFDKVLMFKNYIEQLYASFIEHEQNLTVIDFIFDKLMIFIWDEFLKERYEKLKKDISADQMLDESIQNSKDILIHQVEGMISCLESLLDEYYFPISQNNLENAIENLQNEYHELQEIKNLINIKKINQHIELENQRNVLLRYTLIESIMSTSVGIGALIFGIFGINFESGFEDSGLAFWLVVVITFVLVVTMFMILICSSKEAMQVYY